MAKNRYNIAVIPGDGIGKEVVPEAHKVLKKIAEQHQFKLVIDEFDFSSCDYYEKHGKMLPDDWKKKIEFYRFYQIVVLVVVDIFEVSHQG